MNSELYQRFSSQKWLRRFRACAEKTFFHFPDLQEEAIGFANEKFFEYLSRFCDKPSEDIPSDNYCLAIYRNAVIDCHRRHFGRFEPALWVRENGEPWPEVAKLLALEGLTINEIHLKLKKHPLEDIRFIVEQLQLRPYGKKVSPQIEDIATTESEATDQAMSDEERRWFVEILLNGGGHHPSLPKLIVEKWNQLASEIDLSDDERLFLRMYFYHDMKFTEIAEARKIKEHQVRRPVNNALKRIREAFKRGGIDGDSF